MILVGLFLIFTSMEEALIFFEEYSTETYKSGRVTASCKSDFKYKVLFFLMILLKCYIIKQL